MAEGEFALVKKNLEEGLTKPITWDGDHDLYAMLADAAAERRDEEDLRRYVPMAEATAERYGHRLYLGSAHRAAGVGHQLRKEYSEAEARYGLSLGLLTPLGARWQIGRTLFALGNLQQELGNSGEARQYFARALIEFEGVGAAPYVQRARNALGHPK